MFLESSQLSLQPLLEEAHLWIEKYQDCHGGASKPLATAGNAQSRMSRNGSRRNCREHLCTYSWNLKMEERELWNNGASLGCLGPWEMPTCKQGWKDPMNLCLSGSTDKGGRWAHVFFICSWIHFPFSQYFSVILILK